MLQESASRQESIGIGEAPGCSPGVAGIFLTGREKRCCEAGEFHEIWSGHIHTLQKSTQFLLILPPIGLEIGCSGSGCHHRVENHIAHLMVLQHSPQYCHMSRRREHPDLESRRPGIIKHSIQLVGKESLLDRGHHAQAVGALRSDAAYHRHRECAEMARHSDIGRQPCTTRAIRAPHESHNRHLSGITLHRREVFYLSPGATIQSPQSTPPSDASY